MWTKGRAIPLFGSVCALLVGAALVWATVKGHDRGFITMDVIAFVLFALGIAVAFRRKATLTTQHLVVRKLFQTQALPLREIVHVLERGDSHSLGYRRGLADLVWDIFRPKPVVIELQNKRRCETKSFGWGTGTAKTVILQAARAAGSPIGT